MAPGGFQTVMSKNKLKAGYSEGADIRTGHYPILYPHCPRKYKPNGSSADGPSLLWMKM
jgi:hypothetical protein